MLSDEFLVDLDYIQPVQRGIRLDSPVVASCLRSVSIPVSATMISMVCYNSKMSTLRVPTNFPIIFSESASSKKVKNEVLALYIKNSMSISSQSFFEIKILI